MNAPTDLIAFRNFINEVCLATAGARTEVAEVSELEVSSETCRLPVRLYRPSRDQRLPVLMFFHGGGYLAGNLDTHDPACRYLCHQIGCLVVAVEYRLAPEHRYPAQLEDCFAATVWMAEQTRLHGNGSVPIAVVGDSVGGTLAAGVCHLARDREGPTLCAQVLINPALDYVRWDAPEFDDYRVFRDCHLSDPREAELPGVSPLRAGDFHGLPPALVVVGESDPLRGEGEEFAAKLGEAKVPAELFCHLGQGHLGPRWGAAAPDATEILDLTAAFLKRKLWPGR